MEKTKGGRIDIYIESNNKYIFIENKIYAEDQENQLLRYRNYNLCSKFNVSIFDIRIQKLKHH